MITGVLALLRAALETKPGKDEEPRPEGNELQDEGLAPAEVSEVFAQAPSTKLEIEKVGAWVGRSSFSTASARAKTMKALRYLGLRRVDLIVNDDAEERDPIPYKTYEWLSLINMAAAASAAGIDVHLMSWIMPYTSYVEGAAEQLRELVRLTGAKSVQFDAEEPWTQAHKPQPYNEIAKRIGDLMGGISLGVNAIGYCDAKKIGPLAEVCDYVVPQAYATQTSGLKPTTVIPTLCKRYRALFGKTKRIVVGLAAYRQPPKGYTVESAMRATFGGAEAEENVSEVIYWSLGAVRSSAEVTRVVKTLVAGK